MPFVPSAAEARRLRRAIDIAAFSEGERILWIVSFSALLALCGVLIVVAPTWIGIAGFLGGFFVLYWRLRAVHMSSQVPDELRPLFGLGLAGREQRAFTALMLRYAFTGRNTLAERREHDPYAAFQSRVNP